MIIGAISEPGMKAHIFMVLAKKIRLPAEISREAAKKWWTIVGA